MEKKEVPREFQEWIKEKWGSSKLPIGGVVPYHTSFAYKTGDWASEQPVIDKEKCISCMNCFYFCPDSAIEMDENFKPDVDYDFCKGCGLCAANCPSKAIEMKPVR